MIRCCNTIKIPGKWSGTLLKENQGVYVALTDWTTGNTIPLFHAKCS
jgi:hypothetical protein